jgi:hypothetical protein
VYKLPACKSEGSSHALAVTQHIAEIFYHFDSSIIFREKLIEEVALRPDIMAFVSRDGKGLAFIVEVVLEEPPEYLAMKRTTWEKWAGATEYLSNLFGQKVRWVDFVPSNEFNNYLEEMK